MISRSSPVSSMSESSSSPSVKMVAVSDWEVSLASHSCSSDLEFDVSAAV